ncbi:MAG: DUF4878 domain-containing protein [Aquificaceae bacterium]|nr:DUF4878 domain-containing protein [Aquificaceae bacterium]MCX8164972.1 DUF4878 domain-containing protein [Aquificaceae bacterium]
MKRILLILGMLLLAFLALRACGENPEKSAKNTVKNFIESIREREGKEAVDLLYPPFRDALSQDIKLPIQLTEMKQSELLACLLSSMGEGIKKVRIIDTSKIDDKHVEVIVKVIDKDGIEKIFTFIVIRDEKRWKIASISGIK